MTFEGDLGVFLRDIGSPVVFDGGGTTGILDYGTVSEFVGELVLEKDERGLLVITGSVPDVVDGFALTTEGQDWTVREIRTGSIDNALQLLILAEA